MNKNKNFIKPITAILLFIILSSCKNKPEYLEQQIFLMDTVVEITLKNTVNADKIFHDAFHEMSRVDEEFDRYNNKSFVSRLNNGDMAALTDELLKIIEISLSIGDTTYGAFDITVAPLVDLWDFKNSKIPHERQIKNALRFVGYNKIILNEKSKLVIAKGVKIDLGGIAKGYAIDRAVSVIKEQGMNSALVNAGGDVFALGRKGKRPWKIGIQHPRKSDALLGVLEVENKAVVTSGDYERFFIKDDKRYHHIIDPKTGYPAYGLISVTVVADSAEYADALSTGLFVLGKERALKLIESLHDVDVILVTPDMEIIVTDGIKAYFSITKRYKI
ncbi:MAG: FAD:protein FMN transferase [Elusimicrobiota bacterium]